MFQTENLCYYEEIIARQLRPWVVASHVRVIHYTTPKINGVSFPSLYDTDIHLQSHTRIDQHNSRESGIFDP